MPKDIQLIAPIALIFGSAIEADFPDVARLLQQIIEDRQLAPALMGKLWMKPKRGLDTSALEFSRPVPSRWRGCHGQDVHTLLIAAIGNAYGVREQIKVAMKIDQVTPAAPRKSPSSAKPRLATSLYGARFVSAIVLSRGLIH